MVRITFLLGIISGCSVSFFEWILWNWKMFLTFAIVKNDKEIKDRPLQYPGLRIKQELKKCGLTQKNAAALLAMQPSHLSEIIKGKRNITENVAQKLESLLHVSASEWMRLQAEIDYQMAIGKLANDEEGKAEQLLSEYGHIYDMRIIFKAVGLSREKASTKLNFCRESLHFSSPAVQSSKIQGYFHKSEKTGLDVRMIATWAVIAMYEAEQTAQPMGTFASEKSDELGGKLENVFNDNHNTLNRVARLCSEYGVKFCVVSKVPRASIDGFAFYNNGVPCIVVTKRFDRIDNLAFAVLHELGHLKLHLAQDGIGKVTVVNPDEEHLVKEEREANEYAANLLLPDELWETIPPVKLNPRSIQREFTKWAKEHNKNKWIVLGRISHETNIYMFKSDDTRRIQ